MLFEDICYAWALLYEVQRKGIGASIRVPDLKSVKVSREERYAVLYTYWLLKKLLAGEVSSKRIIFFTALVLTAGIWSISRVLR